MTKKPNGSRVVPNFREKLDILRGLMLLDRKRLANYQIAEDILDIQPTNFAKMLSSTLPISVEDLTRLADEYGHGLFSYQLFYAPLKEFDAELRRLKYGVTQSVASLELSKLIPAKPLESCSVTMNEHSPGPAQPRPAKGRTRGVGRTPPIAPALPRYRIGSKVTITVEGPASSWFVLLETNREAVVSIAPSRHAKSQQLPNGPGKVTRVDLRELDVGDPPGKYFLFGFFTPEWVVPWRGQTEDPVDVSQKDLETFAVRLKALEVEGKGYGVASLPYDIVR